MNKQMKILGRKLKGIPDTVPFSILSEDWAQRIHNQSLERLNERGGMCAAEICINIKRLQYNAKMDNEMIIRVISEQLTRAK